MIEPWGIKLDRAAEHIRELRRAIEEFTASGDVGAMTGQMGAERVVRLIAKREPAPRLSAIVGDVVHNLRSALDCVAVAASEQEQARLLTEAEERLIQFPITRSAEEFKQERKRRLSLVGQRSTELIRSRQPWNLADQASNLDPVRRESAIRHHELRTLAWLSNTDKHRRVHLAAWYPTDVWVAVPDGVTVQWRPGGGEWSDGAEIGRWIVSGPNAETVKLGDNAAVGLTLRYYEEQGWVGVDVADLLSSLLQHVRDWIVVPLAGEIGR
ncbi:MAG: hypothetical protein WBD02_06165 [Acidimicrobiia bacterium]